MLDRDIEAVLAVGRAATGQRHPRLHDLVHPDLLDLASIEGELTGYDACFFCLGVSSAGMDEDAYRRVTYDMTLSVARTLAAHSPNLTFVYVSGQGTGRGGSMWARVKGETENALLALPFHAYMLRPGYIQPMHGIRSKTRWYRMAYAVTALLSHFARRVKNRKVGHETPADLRKRSARTYVRVTSAPVERRKHYWNAKWGRIARRDILIFEDAGNWLVEAREGGVDGASRWFEIADEDAALDLVRGLMDDSADWREL